MDATRVGRMIAALAAALAIGVAAPAAGQPPSPTTEVVHGWPGARRNPAGLYSFGVSPGARAWMHRPSDGAAPAIDSSVELMFSTTQMPAGPETPQDVGSLRESWSADVVLSRPTPRSQIWLVDAGDTRIAIELTAHPGTDPAVVAEAQAVIESIVVEPTGDGYRLVFRLSDRWDSG